MKNVLAALALFTLPLLAFEHADAVNKAKALIDRAEGHSPGVMLDLSYTNSEIMRSANESLDEYGEVLRILSALPLDAEQRRLADELERDMARPRIALPPYCDASTVSPQWDVYSKAARSASASAVIRAESWKGKLNPLINPFLQVLQRERDAADAKRDAESAKSEADYKERSRQEYKGDMLLGSGRVLPTFLDCDTLGSALLYILGLGLLYAFGPMLCLGLLANENSRVIGIVASAAWVYVALPRALEFWTIFIVLPIFAIVGMIKGAVK